MSSSWLDIAAKKRKATFDKIPPKWIIPKHKLPDDSERNVLAVAAKCDILTERDVLITETGMADVLQNLRHGEWTAREVAEAICKRAAIAHQLTNCLTEIFFDEGLARAKELDDYLREHGKPIGPVYSYKVTHLSDLVTWPTSFDKGFIQRQRT
jgi:amidase